MIMMKGVPFLLMTITTLIMLSSSTISAKELESLPLNPQLQQSKLKLSNCGSELFFSGWECWKDFIANKNSVQCCTTLVDIMDCPFNIIPDNEKQDVKDFCSDVVRTSGPDASGPVSSPVRLAVLGKNTAVQAHDSGEN